MATYYHGTAKAVLPSIAKHGLLRSMDVERFGGTVVHPDYSKPDKVYFTNSYNTAINWGWCHPKAQSTPISVVLSVDLDETEQSRIQPDENFYFSMASSPTKFEYDGWIRPEKIIIIDGNLKMPLCEYVEKMYEQGEQ